MNTFHQEKGAENFMRKEERIKALQKELAEAMEQLEDEFSLQRIDALTAELERLEASAFDVEQAKAEFFHTYFPLAEEKDEWKQQTVHRGRPRRKLKAAVVLAAVFLCLNGATVAIAGMNLFEAIFRWDEETFQISVDDSNGAPSAKKERQEIISKEGTAWAELEAEFGAEIPVIGYLVENMEITSMKCLGENNRLADIDFSDGEKEYFYSAKKLQYGGGTTYVEKTAEEPLIYEVGGITYYFAQNRRWMSIIWQYKNQLYILSGDFDTEQAKMIVKSIQYEEE